MPCLVADASMRPAMVVLSPGPGTPSDFGITDIINSVREVKCTDWLIFEKKDFFLKRNTYIAQSLSLVFF